LHELQQANSLANKTRKNVKKIAKSNNPNFMTASEMNLVEDEIST